MMKKKWYMTISSVLLAVFLVGCSAQTAQTGDDSAGTGGNARAVEVALVNNNAPFEYADANGTIKGFDYDALKKIDELIPEYEFHFQLVEYDAEVVGIQSGKYQIGAGNHFYTEERAKTYLLSKAYDYNVIKLIVPEDSSINSLEDMDGKSVQPMPSYDGMYIVLQNFLEKNPDIEIGCENAQLTSYADTFNGVADGRWDAGLVPEVAYDAAQKELNLPLKKSDIVDAVGNYFLINKKEADLQQKIDAAIDQLLEENWLQELSKQYFGVDVFKEYSSRHPEYDDSNQAQ